MTLSEEKKVPGSRSSDSDAIQNKNSCDGSTPCIDARDSGCDDGPMQFSIKNLVGIMYDPYICLLPIQQLDLSTENA